TLKFLQIPPNLYKLSCSGTTCIHIIRPAAGLRAAASRWGTARVEDIIHWALHLTVVNGLALQSEAGQGFPLKINSVPGDVGAYFCVCLHIPTNTYICDQ
uniref:Ig-like domain-containing protein n=1 Tax=Astatotilapia calliptera TaxID=8154 RepID=A0AAX7TME1_ASTCA